MTERAEYGDEVTVGKESGVVKGSVGVPGGREVTVFVADDKDAEVRSFGVMESAKYSAANANGEEETRKLNEERWAASAKDNEEADEVQQKVEEADDSAEAAKVKQEAVNDGKAAPAVRTQSSKASAAQGNNTK